MPRLPHPSPRPLLPPNRYAAFTAALTSLGMTKKALLANVNLMSQVSHHSML